MGRWPRRRAQFAPHRLASTHPAADELSGVHDFVEALFVDRTGRDGGLSQREAVIVCCMRDRRSLVVSNDGTQGRDEHQRAADHLIDVLAIELRAFDRELPQLVARVAQNVPNLRSMD
jgi:hypothetical protein